MKLKEKQHHQHPKTPTSGLKFSLVHQCEVADNATIWDHVNLYRCVVGERSKVESFVVAEGGVVIGDDCVVKPHCFLAAGTRIYDHVFLGPGVVTCNDKHPVAHNKEFDSKPPVIRDWASIGAGAIILPGVEIGAHAVIGAGAIVTRDVPPKTTVTGNPARKVTR